MNKKNDPLHILGERIRKRRIKLGWSQETLAEHSNLHRTYIGAVERGERNISVINILKISRALDVDPSLLLKNLSLPAEKLG